MNILMWFNKLHFKNWKECGDSVSKIDTIWLISYLKIGIIFQMSLIVGFYNWLSITLQI